MSLEELVIDAQLYQGEPKKPTTNSVILLPVQNITTKKNQILLKWSNKTLNMSQKGLDQAAQIFFSEWALAFPLYPVERAFLDTTKHGNLEMLITFDASSLYSNTQIRNIKSTSPRLLKKALETTSDSIEQNELGQTSSLSGHYDQISQVKESNFVQLEADKKDLNQKQKLNQKLENSLTGNDQFIETLQSDLMKLRQENETLKDTIIHLKDIEMDYTQKNQASETEVFILKTRIADLMLEVENGVEEWRQKYQRAQFETEELRLIITENQEFENRELVEAWEKKYSDVVNKKEEITSQYELLVEQLQSQQQEILELSEKNIQKDYQIQQLNYEHIQQQEEYSQIIAQKEVDKDNLERTKDAEIERLSKRLSQQQTLVSQVMDSQKNNQIKWQENYSKIEQNYRIASEKVLSLEKELSQLRQANIQLQYRSEQSLASESLDVELPKDVDLPQALDIKLPTYADEVVHTEVDTETVKVVEDSSVEVSDEEYAYEDDYDEDYDYEYDYEYAYDYDYSDYDDYSEDDDVLGYDAESVMDDVDELLYESAEEDGTVKISKKEYELFKHSLDELKERWEELGDQDLKFKEWATPKMKKFKRFDKGLDSNVTPPKLFSRKYKMEESVWCEMQAYALISRHIETILSQD